jgi:hypothetical protein
MLYPIGCNFMYTNLLFETDKNSCDLESMGKVFYLRLTMWWIDTGPVKNISLSLYLSLYTGHNLLGVHFIAFHAQRQPDRTQHK